MVERSVSPCLPVHLQSQVVPGMKVSLDNFCFMNNQAGQGLVCVIEFQLNIMMPVMGQATLESIQLLTAATQAFVDFCVDGMEANVAACEAAVEQSLSMVTSLNPHIGYEKASKLAKEAFQSGKTIRELCVEQEILPEEILADVLDPIKMTEPQA